MSTSARGSVRIADVAREAGVSRTTVSHALTGKGRVDPATRARVSAAAERLGYRPNVRAQRLRGGRSKTVAILSALPPSIVGENSEMGFLIDLAVPAARACLAHGYAMLLVPPGAPREHLDGLDIDGAIVLDPREDDPNWAALSARGITVVTIGEARGVVPDGVLERGLAGAETMIDHLVAEGARRIGVIVSEEQHALSALLPDAFAAWGWRRGDAEIVLARARASDGTDAGARVTAELLAREPGLDAVYAPLDAFAVGAMQAVTASGRRVPDDVRIATNYDGPRAVACSPQLTTLDLDLPEMGRIAVAMLVALLDDAPVPRRTAPAPRVIVRGSTRAGASSGPVVSLG